MESTLRDLNSEAVMRLDESIGLVVTAMNQIRYASKSELVDCLKNPVDNLNEQIQTVRLGRNIRVHMDFRTPVIAEVMKRSDARRSFTVALLMEYLETVWPSLSLRAVYEYLLEDTHGVSFDQDVLYNSMPEPSTDSRMLSSDIFICALVVRVNMMSSMIDEWETSGSSSHSDLALDSDTALLASMFLDRALVVGPFFEKLEEMDVFRRNGLDSMSRVTPSAFVKSISQGKIFNVLERSVEIRELINGLLWPDLLKFIELCHRRFEVDTKQPVALCDREDIMQVDKKEAFNCNHLVESFQSTLTL